MHAAPDPAFYAPPQCVHRPGKLAVLAALLLALAPLSCGTDPASATTIATPDTVSDDATRFDANGGISEDEPDIPIVSLDSLLGEDLPVPLEVFLPDDTSPGEFAAPCTDNSECDSGFCVPGPTGSYICSRYCIDDCPQGWLCKGVPETEPDIAFICIVGTVQLCAPCNVDEDCGGSLDRCQAIGTQGATYCTQHCLDSGGCPSGYSCSPPTDQVGSSQCVPDTGSCVCSAQVNQTSRACQFKNEFGNCGGLEFCDGPDGWDGCDAKVPTADACNGLDDNCDGATDEGFAPKPCSRSTLFGTCAGVETCTGLTGLVCDAKTPAAETCNGFDDDCNGYTDDDYTDTDGDTLSDCVDPDDDDDTVPDSADNCPFEPNFNQLDADTDGDGDSCDIDRDGDGVDNVSDICPAAFDPAQTDIDADGKGDACDEDRDGDGDGNGTDCEPDDALISKSAVEACDALDNDCDGLYDEGFLDTDADQLRDCIDPDDDNDGDPDTTDCAPLNPLVKKGKKEDCDTIDNDCDGLVDEDFGDLDKNGIKDCIETDADVDGDPDGVDCAPNNKSISHLAPEVCDSIDNDCDGLIDESFPNADGDALRDCIDADDDNDGDPDETDCAPLNKTVGSTLPEICNGKDDDCDLFVDEGFQNLDGDGQADCQDQDDDNDELDDVDDNCPRVPNPDQADSDGDGSGDTCDDDDDNDGEDDSADNCPFAANSGQTDTDGDEAGDVCDPDDDNDGSLDTVDCRPRNAAVNPGATEVCDGIDQDCDLLVDDGFPDTDGDSVADCVDSDDDNDGDPDVSDCKPLAPETSNKSLESCDGLDNNCNGTVDEGFTDGDDDGAADCVDLDDDNDGDADATDCDPTNPLVRNGATELCNGKDDDCSGVIDDGFVDSDGDKTPDCADLDDDNDGDPDVTDCASLKQSISNTAAELCDGLDNDCDDVIDEGFVDTDVDGKADCLDLDDDGDGDPDNTDCAPKNPAVKNGGTELCNGKDDDCDGSVDEGFSNVDGDTLADCADIDDDNDGDPDSSDCALLDPTISSLLSELCDGKDNNCSGAADEGFPDTDQDGDADCVDLDDDGDGVVDAADNCALIKNASQTDSDGDGQGDLCDTDVDNDGAPNASDNCPTTTNGTQLDTDVDGKGDVCDTDDDGDGSLDTVDCKPLDPSTFPGAVEVCDSKDNNCNELADEGFGDTDNDGVGDCLDSDDDGDLDPDIFDCEPLLESISHFEAELCDGTDQNCDSLVDEGFPDFDLDGDANCIDADDDGDGVPDAVDNCPIAKNTDQADPDADGKGNPCDTDDDGDGAPDAQDCAPLNAAIFPLQTEACDGIDNNCKLGIDEGFVNTDSDTQADCIDADDDGDGDADNIDCAVLNKNISSSATETCDGVDNNCNGGIDEGLPDFDTDGTPDCRDLDDDNDGSADTVDCAPNNSAIRPGAFEACNGKDDNCSGTTDEGFPDTDGDSSKNCIDTDDDNDGDPDTSDCQPLSALVSKLAVEACNGVDDNCSGQTDEGFTNSDTDSAADCVDADDDNDGDPDTSDCAPKNPAISKLAIEVCNGKDDDCDSLIDEGFSNLDGDSDADCVDVDDDNDGDPDVTDCQDNNPSVSTLVTEVCDNQDNDCDGLKDEGVPDADVDGLADCLDLDDDNDGTADTSDNCPTVANNQTDTDGDKLGDACDSDDDNDGRPDSTDNCPTVPNADQTNSDTDALGNACDPDDDGDGILDAADCAPTNVLIFPGAMELCDGVDNDCDTIVDEGFVDTDLDTLRDCIDPDDDNDLTGDLGDCAPLNSAVHPAAVEICDGIDQNCNGVKDDGFPNTDGDAQADCVDTDLDNDGVLNATDNCPKVQNQIQTDTDGDKTGDACDGDDDNDDVADESDNCRTVANASQTNTDGDNQGNACDDDDDNDGTLDTSDCRPLDSLVHPSAIELCDGVDNSCKGVADFGFPDFDQDTIRDCVDTDDDNDGDPDTSDCAPKDKTVFNGAPELCDGFDSNCNGAIDETFPNLDGDTEADCVDDDDDNDGSPDSSDNCPIASNLDQKDVDEDNIGDACDPQVPGPVTSIVIRDAAKGQGAAVGTLTMELGQTITVYAAGYDVNGLFAGGQAVTWSRDGTLDLPVAATDKKTATFTPSTPVTSGRLIASGLTPGVLGDATGIITVKAPPAGAPLALKCTIEPDRDSIVADSLDEVTVRVIVRDQYGTPTTIGAPHTIAIQTSAGTLVGAVANAGGGVYTQRLRSSIVEETASLTAKLGGVTVGGSAQVKFVQPELVVSGSSTIDCSNYNAFEGKSILVKSGILTINTTDACPLMKFGSFIMQGGFVTHGKGARMDIEVDELFVGAGAFIDASGEGPATGAASPPIISVPFELFGDLENPRTSGRSNCPTAPPSFVTAPGGLIRIKVVGSGKATIDGAIRADGIGECILDVPYSSNSLRAGDPGGRIRLEAKTLAGTGTISARGRPVPGSDVSALSKIAGNGGVISLVGFESRTGSFADATILEKVSVRSGVAVYNKGPAGALVLRASGQTEPDIIFGAGADEGTPATGTNATAGVATLTTIPMGVVTAVDSVSITIAGAGFSPGRYVGLWVNPNVEQGALSNFQEDVTYRVISNTADRLFLSGNPTGVAVVGKAAVGVLIAKNLELREETAVETSGLVVIRSGDRATGDEATFDAKGGLIAGTIDFGTVETIRLTGLLAGVNYGGGTVQVGAANLLADSIVRAGNASFPFNLVMSSGASFETGDLATFSAVTLSRATIRAGGDVTVQGALSVSSAVGRSSIRSVGSNVGQTFSLVSGSGNVNLGALELDFPVVDLGAATGFTIVNSGSSSGRLHTGSLQRQGDAAFPFEMTLTGSELSGLPVATASTVALTANSFAAATIDVGELTMTGPFTVTGSSAVVNLSGGDLTASAVDLLGGTHSIGDIYADGDVTISASTVDVGGILAGGAFTIDGGAFVNATDIVVDGDAFIQGTSTLSHPPCTNTAVFDLEFTGKNLTIATGSNINVNRRGYAQGRSFGNVVGAGLGVGGSYGGVGGTALEGGAAQLTYGSLLDPRLPGGGGGGIEANGGGSVAITLTGTLALNGTIMANGKDISGGAGAGGSVKVTAIVVAGAGAGRMQALGGDATDGTSGGGGGGRIAIVGYAALTGNFAAANIMSFVDASGGTGYVPGGAGTIALKASVDSRPTLIVSNQGLLAPAGSTPLPGLPAGTVTAEAATTLTSSVSFGDANRHVSSTFNPRVGQGLATLLDDTVFDVASHTGSVVTATATGVSGISVVGQPYRAVVRLKNLEITGGAQVLVPGDLLVLEGDLAGSDLTRFHVGASSSLTGSTIDLQGVTPATTSGTIAATSLLCSGCP